MTKEIVKTLNELDPQSREHAVSNFITIFSEFHELFSLTDISCREMIDSVVSKTTLQFTCSGEVVIDAAGFIKTCELLRHASSYASCDYPLFLKWYERRLKS